MSKFADKLKGIDYQEAFTWGWDGKPHAGNVVWFREPGSGGTFVGDSYLVVCDERHKSVADGPVSLYRTGVRWGVKTQSGQKMLLPNNSVTDKSYMGVVYHVCEIPSVWTLKEGSTVKDVVGCFGCADRRGGMAIFNVDLDRFQLQDGMEVQTWEIFAEVNALRTSPAYSFTPSNQQLVAVDLTKSTPAAFAMIGDYADRKISELLKDAYMPSDPAYRGGESIEESLERTSSQEEWEPVAKAKELMKQHDLRISEEVVNVVKGGFRRASVVPDLTQEEKFNEEVRLTRKKWKEECGATSDNFIPRLSVVESSIEEKENPVLAASWIKDVTPQEKFKSDLPRVKVPAKPLPPMKFPKPWKTDKKFVFEEE